jgi:hypothetical protein
VKNSWILDMIHMHSLILYDFSTYVDICKLLNF